MLDPRPVLRRADRTPPLRSLLVRAGLVLALFAAVLAYHWFDRFGLKDNIDGHITFIDVLYFTAITVTTVGYGDIVPVSERARLFETIFVTPIRLFIFLIFLGTAYDFVLRDRWERYRAKGLKRMLNDHVIVCGYGATGRETVAELLARGADPASIVVIDGDVEQLRGAGALGVLTITGDATRNETLEEAMVARARAVVVAPGRDDTAVLIVLTANSLNPRAAISVEIFSRDNEGLARRAGADTVVNPVCFGGQLLASVTGGRNLAAYVGDLVTGGGRVVLRERPVEPHEIGRAIGAAPGAITLRVLRHGRELGFWEPEASPLQPGDQLIEVAHVEPRPAAAR